MNKRTFWTDDEVAQVKALYADMPTQDLAKRLGRSDRAVYQAALKFDLKKSEQYMKTQKPGRFDGIRGGASRFTKGQAAWNKGIKGLDLSGGKGQFTAGHMPTNHKPVGSTRLDKDGYQMIKTAEPKKRKCANQACRTPFEKRSMSHVACSPACALLVAVEKREKAERKDIVVRKQAIKTRTDYLKEAQIAFNAFIRARDSHLPCISCGRFHEGAWDAGHYRSVGSNPALRFHEDNCHRQCVPCNQHKSGNAVDYRIGLVARIGADRVAALEGPHEAKKYSIDEIKAIKQHYKQKLKALKAASTD